MGVGLCFVSVSGGCVGVVCGVAVTVVGVCVHGVVYAMGVKRGVAPCVIRRVGCGAHAIVVRDAWYGWCGAWRRRV
jgi:hypothetical protein